MLIDSVAHLSKVNSIVTTTDSKPLEEVKSLSYLGIVINKNLTWDDHLNHIRGKINKKLGLLRRIKPYLLLIAQLTFFNSFILPLFYYGDIIWGDRGNVTLMAELQILHK